MLNFNQDKLLAWDLEIFEGNEKSLVKLYFEYRRGSFLLPITIYNFFREIVFGGVWETIDLFYFHDFPNRIGYFDVIVQISELSGLAADGVEWNESTRVWKAGPAYSYFFIQ